MLIKTEAYKGVTYEVHFTDKGDWRDNLNKFYVQNSGSIVNNEDYFLTYTDAVSHANICIDNFISLIPESVEKLTEEIGKLLVWTGYEDCHLDEEAAYTLINNYINAKVKT